MPAGLRVARNTVRSALTADEPPRYALPAGGSKVDVFVPAIRKLLSEFPDMPASVIAERVGREFSASVLRAKVAEPRPLHRPADPADRITYVAGQIVQCDLWFPGRVVPADAGPVLADPPVLTMVAAFSGFIMALLLPSRTTDDLVAGMWLLLAGLDAVPKVFLWDNESGIGERCRLTMYSRDITNSPDRSRGTTSTVYVMIDIHSRMIVARTCTTSNKTARPAVHLMNEVFGVQGVPAVVHGTGASR